jgi:hypothetical protein
MVQIGNGVFADEKSRRLPAFLLVGGARLELPTNGLKAGTV